ncbi:MAG TPA: 3'-5' exonuclease [Trinickia sp.]|nr:3'-5' exonuclease [Trinickia sp.]
MRAELTAPAITLTAAQQRVAEATDTTIVATGMAASGKTTALAACALACRARGSEPVIVCSHESGRQAFNEAVRLLRRDSDDQKPFAVAPLADHAARWLSSAYLAAGAAPQIAVGGKRAGLHVLTQAAKGLLDMSWPMFARADINLDLPHLSRPEAFLEEASSLFSLLQRARVTPEEFEEGCAAGLAAFYGERIERASALVQDPVVRKRASARGRSALQASGETLAAQRAAERDTGIILTQLYRDYRAAAASSGVRSPEDIIDSAIRWLMEDEREARALASRIEAFIVDDAEDAEPSLAAAIHVLRKHHAFAVIIAGSEAVRIDGFEGRRSALSSFTDATRIELAPLAPPAAQTIQRFADELQEADWIATQIRDVLRQGVAPERIALLTRTDHAAAVYAQLLRERGVPASKPSAVLEREDEVSDLLALCAIVDNPLDTEHLLRVLSSPLAGLSDASLWALCREPAERLQLTLEVGAPDVTAAVKSPKPDTLARNFLGGHADSVLPEPTRAMLATLRAELARWRSHCCNLSPVERFAYLADAAGFVDRWHAAPEHERDRLRLDLTRTAAAVAEAAALSGAQDFSAIARLIEDNVVALPRAARIPGAVVTESIVAVKGLRFDHVFVAGVAHERFPRIYTSRAMAFSRTYGLIVRENIAGGAAQTAKFAWYYAKFGAKAMYIDEERRALAYGLSRARIGAAATGYGTPPYWAREHDLLAGLEGKEQ